MDLNAIRRRLDDERRSLVRTGECVQALALATRLQCGDSHNVVYSALDETNADAAIAEEIAYHARLGAAFEWKLYAHDRPADLRERLQRAGFEIGAAEAVMVCDLSAVSAWLAASGAGSHDSMRIDVRAIDEPVQVAEFACVSEAVFGPGRDFITAELAAAVNVRSTEHRGYLAYIDDQPVGVGRLYTHPLSEFAGCYGGGVLTEHRGRGVYRALLAARARAAIESGARWLLVDALTTSRPILERLGFERLTETWPCERQPLLQGL